MRPRLFINNIPSLDRLIALEYGRVDDGYDPRFFCQLEESVWCYEDPDNHHPVGFSVLEVSKLDLHDSSNESLWVGDRFDAPTLGLSDANIGEIIAATRASLGAEPSLNRVYFESATTLRGQDAVNAWRMCLECGDSMAHFGLGCALYDQGEYREAFQHLRYYCQIAPIMAWNWRWYGAAAEAIGETREARLAYEEAVRLVEQYCQEETDAAERLQQLGSS